MPHVLSTVDAKGNEIEAGDIIVRLNGGTYSWGGTEALVDHIDGFGRVWIVRPGHSIKTWTTAKSSLIYEKGKGKGHNYLDGDVI